MQKQDDAHGCLTSLDIVSCVFIHLHRYQALRASLTCKAWRAAFTTLDSQPVRPFRPRVLMTCSRLARVVDVSDLVNPYRAPLPDQLAGPDGAGSSRSSGRGGLRGVAAGPHNPVETIAGLPSSRQPDPRRRPRVHPDNRRDPCWFTSLAVSPYGGHDVYVCQYRSRGLVCFGRAPLRYLRAAVGCAGMREPEGVAFASGCAYVTTNWGCLSRVEVASWSVVEQGHICPGLVTWNLVAGPPGDNSLYCTVDEQYQAPIYTQPPPGPARGYVVRVRLGPGGSLAGLTWGRYTSTDHPLRRPSGLKFGPACGSLFATSMDGPSVVRFAGPSHATPGALLAVIGPLGPGWALPWDVAVTPGGQVVVTMHRNSRQRQATTAKRGAPATTAAPAPSSTQEAGPSQAGTSAGPASRRSHGGAGAAGGGKGGSHDDDCAQEVEEAAGMGSDGPGQDRARCYLCVAAADGSAMRTAQLPACLDHANMLCLDEW